MIEELNTASELLHAALERYFTICSTIQASCHANGSQLNGALQELPDRISKELLLADSYQAKLEQSKTAISQSRNSFNCVVPINGLSSETLAHIFGLVLGMQDCPTEDKTMDFPKYPDLLSHVCSRWREVALGSRTLWSHIDLAPCHSFHQGLLARAEVYATRAGNLPLSLHVITLDYEFDYDDDIRDTLEEFLASVATRVRSLEIVPGEASTVEESVIDVDIVESCLVNCVPGTLTRLAISNRTYKLLGFLQADDATSDIPNHLWWMPLGIPPELLEDIFGAVTSLRLYGLYPYWTSQAYRGLVELRLTSRRAPGITIPESQFVNILSSSPKLRVLDFELSVTDSLPLDASVTPVHLDELEVLGVNTMSNDQLEVVLRWLAPGSVPLDLLIVVDPNERLFMLNTGLVAFFTRSGSSITTFHLYAGSSYFSVFNELLDLLPNLRVLAIQVLMMMAGHAHSEASTRTDEHNPAFRLDRLELFCGTIHLDSLLEFVERNPIQELTFQRCRFTGKQARSGTQRIKTKLYEFCAVVEELAESD